jgi:tetratricopeptide (TPR) repeat protein
MGRYVGWPLLAALFCASGVHAQSPGSAEYYLKYGKEYADAGKADMAELYFKEGAAMYPRNAQMHSYLGQMLAAQGKKAEALAELQLAVRLDPAVKSGVEKAIAYYGLSAADAQPQPDSGLLVPRTAKAGIQVGDPIEVKDHASGDWYAGTVTQVEDISDNGTQFVYKVKYANQVGPTENRFYPGSWRAPTGQVEQPGGPPSSKSGGALAAGDYVCTQDYFTGGTGNYQRQSDQKGTLTVSAGGSYSFRGEGGRYAYDAASGQIKWLSGYLAADSNTSKYRRNQRTSQIDIAFHTASGDLDWSCGHNL